MKHVLQGVVVGAIATSLVAAASVGVAAAPSLMATDAPLPVELPADPPSPTVVIDNNGEPLEIVDVGSTIDLGRAVVVSDAEPLVIKGPQRSGTMQCFAVVTEAGPKGRGITGCDSAEALRLNGAVLVEHWTDGRALGAVVLPRGAEEATLNGAPVAAPDGVVSFTGLPAADEIVVSATRASGADWNVSIPGVPS